MLLSSPMKFTVRSSFFSPSHPVERSEKKTKQKNKKSHCIIDLSGLTQWLVISHQTFKSFYILIVDKRIVSQPTEVCMCGEGVGNSLTMESEGEKHLWG